MMSGVRLHCVFALLIGATLLSALGCGRIRNQFPDRRFAREYVPAATQPVVMAPVVETDDFTTQALATLPGSVQIEFVRDHPGALITAVEQVPSGAGPMYYAISYTHDGAPAIVTYEAGGVDLDPPVVVVRPHDTGRPRAKYAPETNPEAQAGTPPGAID